MFEQKQIEIPNDPKLIMQINSLRYEISKSATSSSRPKTKTASTTTIYGRSP
jgi:hypothetical protein